MKLKLVLRKDMKKRYSFMERIKRRLSHLKRTYRNKQNNIILDVITFTLPAWDVLGLFIPKKKIVVDIESIYKFHSGSDVTFINKFSKVLCHEIHHSEIYKITKRLTTRQEHWAIRRMGF